MYGSPVAVIVPNWNSLGYLERCLERLERDPAALELLVVDSASTDGSREFLSRRGIAHLALGENRGFGPAVEAGLERTSAPVVFILNVDAFVEPGCVGRLVAELDSDPALGGVQPKILQADTSPPLLYSAGQRLLSDGRAVEEGAGLRDGPPYDSPREIFGVCGAAFLVRRELLEAVGGFDHRYFAFYEDVDLNARARILGWSFRYVPDAVVWHAGGATWAGRPDSARFNARLVARNRLATTVKVLPARYAWRVAYADLGSLVRGVRHRTFAAKLGGMVSVLRWLPALLRERRDLDRRGSRRRLEHWFDQEPRWLASWAMTRIRPTADPGGNP